MLFMWVSCLASYKGLLYDYTRIKLGKYWSLTHEIGYPVYEAIGHPRPKPESLSKFNSSIVCDCGSAYVVQRSTA